MKKAQIGSILSDVALQLVCLTRRLAWCDDGNKSRWQAGSELQKRSSVRQPVRATARGCTMHDAGRAVAFLCDPFRRRRHQVESILAPVSHRECRRRSGWTARYGCIVRMIARRHIRNRCSVAPLCMWISAESGIPFWGRQLAVMI